MNETLHDAATWAAALLITVVIMSAFLRLGAWLPCPPPLLRLYQRRQTGYAFAAVVIGVGFVAVNHLLPSTVSGWVAWLNYPLCTVVAWPWLKHPALLSAPSPSMLPRMGIDRVDAAVIARQLAEALDTEWEDTADVRRRVTAVAEEAYARGLTTSLPGSEKQRRIFARMFVGCGSGYGVRHSFVQSRMAFPRLRDVRGTYARLGALRGTGAYLLGRPQLRRDPLKMTGVPAFTGDPDAGVDW